MAALALSFPNMHLSAALRTGLSPRRWGRIHHNRLVRFLRLHLLHAFLVRLSLGTLRMNSRWRIRDLATDRARFARGRRIHRTWFFLIHGILLLELATSRAWYQSGYRDSISLAKGAGNAAYRSTLGTSWSVTCTSIGLSPRITVRRTTSPTSCKSNERYKSSWFRTS